MLNRQINLFLCLFNHLFNSCGMDTAIGDKFFKRNSCNLTAHRVKA